MLVTLYAAQLLSDVACCLCPTGLHGAPAGVPEAHAQEDEKHGQLEHRPCGTGECIQRLLWHSDNALAVLGDLSSCNHQE